MNVQFLRKFTAAEQRAYNMGYHEGLKNQKPFKYVPDITPIDSFDVFSKIISKVSHYYKIGKAELFGNSRNGYLIVPRSIAMNLAKELTGFSYPQLKELTERDHTTIIYHVALRINKKGVWKNDNNHAIYNKLKQELLDEANENRS